MVRAIVAVVVGFVVWTALWLGGNAVFFSAVAESAAKNSRVEAPRTLLGLLALSVACSLAAGAACAALARGPRPTLVLGAILLLVGAGVEASMWSLLPAWYHAVFLLLLVPATVVGGRLSPRPGVH